MDNYSGGSLVDLPSELTSRVAIKLSTREQILATFKEIEQSHWDYLDNYRDHNRRKYPSLKINEYARMLFHKKSVFDKDHLIDGCLRLYNRHKKSLPTAGVLLYHDNESGDPEFVVIRMRYSKIWSMPKGKKDASDVDLLTTALREFKEETGLDLEDCLDNNTPSRSISGTQFYLMESDSKNQHFRGYNTKEVDQVKWVSTREVLEHQEFYSKQAVSAARILNRYLAEPRYPTNSLINAIQQA